MNFILQNLRSVIGFSKGRSFAEATTAPFAPLVAMQQSDFMDEMDEMNDMDLFIENPPPMRVSMPMAKGLLARIEELCISGGSQ